MSKHRQTFVDQPMRLTRSMSKRRETAVDPTMRLTRSMSKRRQTAVDPNHRHRQTTKQPNRRGHKRKSCSWFDVIEEQEKAAWDYVTRVRPPGPVKKVTVDWEKTVIFKAPPPLNLSDDDHRQFLTDLGVIWSTRPPLRRQDIELAQQNAPDPKLKSVLEIVITRVQLSQKDLIYLALASYWVLKMIESHDSLFLTLDFQGMSNAGDRLLAALSMARYGKVEHINLEAAQDIGDGHLRLLTTKPMDSVVSFNLNGCQNIQYGIYYVAITFPKLKHFSISNNLKVKDNYFAPLLKNCKFLTDLNLSGCKNITDEGLYFISFWCRTLESLNIDRCELVTDKGVMYIAEACKHLKYLSFFGIVGISDKCFQTLSKFCPKTLTAPDVLKSSGMVNLSQRLPDGQSGLKIWPADGGLYQIGFLCRTLESSNIDRCGLVTEIGVMYIAEKCQTPQISEASIRFLVEVEYEEKDAEYDTKE